MISVFYFVRLYCAVQLSCILGTLSLKLPPQRVPQEGIRPPSGNNVTCDPTSLKHVVSSIQGKKPYYSNACLGNEDWNRFLRNEEDVDDINEFVAVEDGADFQAQCKKTLLPTLLYIGLNRGGSTTFASLLNGLPGWSHGKMKEHQFFGDSADQYFTGFPRMPKMTPSYQDYVSDFTVPCDVNQTFDASPFYWALGNKKLKSTSFLRSPGQESMRLIKDTLGSDIKIVFAIKDPVDWLVSMHRLRDQEAENLTCYADSLDGWLSAFPRNSFLFLKIPDAFKDLAGTIGRITEFAHRGPPIDIPTTFASGRRRTQSVASDNYRVEFHAKHKECKRRLEAQTGLTFDWHGSES